MEKSASSHLGKLQVVDLVRTFAILSVMAYHMYGMAPPGPPLIWFWQPLAENGVYGVWIFFVVSGFLITRIIDGGEDKLFKPNFKEFYVRRAARILPLLFLHILVGAYMIHNVTQFGLLFWASLFTFTYNWYQAFFPNPVPGLYWGMLWSLSVEEQFYFFYPPLLRRLGRQKKLLIFMLSFIVIGFFWRSGFLLNSAESPIFFYKTSFGAFDQIAIGVLLYLAVKRYRAYLSAHQGLGFFLCALGLLITAGTYFFTNSNKQVDDIYSPATVAVGTFLFILGGLHLPFFESKYCRFLTWTGKYSYGIYLFHSLIYYFIYTSLLKDRNIVVAFAIFATMSTIIMAFSYHLFEVPTNRFIRRIFGVKTSVGN
ncbi:MAG TPA: acyltransferase [bacterium]|jgi:peptidoglycan/LPS O-acetylase OafA/YrhL|nr:acyltransferase [bacterium]